LLIVEFLLNTNICQCGSGLLVINFYALGVDQDQPGVAARVLTKCRWALSHLAGFPPV
jgi:hypothetical protein